MRRWRFLEWLHLAKLKSKIGKTETEKEEDNVAKTFDDG